MSIEESKALARRWSEEIWRKGNLDAIDEFFASDFVFNYAPPGVSHDREGYKKTVTSLCGPFDDIDTTTEDMVAEGDKVAVRWTWRGTHKGEYMGIAPTGKRVTITGISIIHIVGGKVAEEWGEMDDMGMMAQLGVFPPQG